MSGGGCGQCTISLECEELLRNIRRRKMNLCFVACFFLQGLPFKVWKYKPLLFLLIIIAAKTIHTSHLSSKESQNIRWTVSMWPPSKWSLTVLKLNTRSVWISEEGEISEVNLGVKAQDDSLWFLLKGSKKRLAYLGIAGLIREGGVVKIWQKCFSKGMNLVSKYTLIYNGNFNCRHCNRG